MKTAISLLDNSDVNPALCLTRSKISVSILPKALIIKIEEITPQELYSSMKKVNNNNTQTQSQSASDWYIKNRQHCVDYIRKCCDRCKLRDNTFFCALDYADRVLSSSTKLHPKTFDIIIISCIVLAAKFAENDAYELDLNDFQTLEGNNVYNMHDIKIREVKTIKELQYNLNGSTTYDYLICQMACGVIFNDEFPDKRNVNKFYSHSKNLLIQVLSSNIGLNYPYEVLALAVISFSRKYFELNKTRMNSIKDKLHFDQNVLYERCIQDISNLLDVNAAFISKRETMQKLKADKKKKGANPLYQSNPEVLNQYRRNTISNKMTITPRTINTITVNTIKIEDMHLNNNISNKQKPLDSTCSTIKPDNGIIYDSIKVSAKKIDIIKPKNMTTNELFNFKNHSNKKNKVTTSHNSNKNSKRFLLTSCNLPIIEVRK